MRLNFHAAALADLENIHDHIANDSPAVAAAVLRRLMLSLDHLGDFPLAGRVGSVDGTREIVVPGLPYIIVYELAEESIDVIAVFHTARDRSG